MIIKGWRLVGRRKWVNRRGDEVEIVSHGRGKYVVYVNHAPHEERKRVTEAINCAVDYMKTHAGG